MLSEIFLSFVVGSASALCAITLKLCYDSKCKKIELCCIKIERDTAGEISEDKYKIDHGIFPKEIELPKSPLEKFQDVENPL
jgi:hypothetical protein